MECASRSFASALGLVVLGGWDRAVCAGRVCPGPVDELGQERECPAGREEKPLGGKCKVSTESGLECLEEPICKVAKTS